MKYIISAILLFLITVSCEMQKPPKVIVNSKSSGFSTNFYFDIELKNVGEQPAYFVVMIATALNSENQIIQTVEKSYGDLFPDEAVSKRLNFNQVFREPDSLDIDITYRLTLDQGY